MHAAALCSDTLSARFVRLAPPSSTEAAVSSPPPGTVATGTERSVDKSVPKGVGEIGEAKSGLVGAVRSLSCSSQTARESSGRHCHLCCASGEATYQAVAQTQGDLFVLHTWSRVPETFRNSFNTTWNGGGRWRLCVCVYSKCACVYICVCTCACMCVHGMCECVHMCAHVCVCVHVGMHMPPCVYAEVGG